MGSLDRSLLDRDGLKAVEREVWERSMAWIDLRLLVIDSAGDTSQTSRRGWDPNAQEGPQIRLQK